MLSWWVALWFGSAGRGNAEELRSGVLHLDAGARIAIVGDGLASGMARFGYLETALHLAYPDRNLTIRSFAQEGFRVDEAESVIGTGGVDAEVAAFGPDLIFVCAGANESFDGTERVAAFGKALRERCQAWGKARPGAAERARIELIPPLPYVQSAPGLPDEAAFNARLSLYSQEMRAIAEEAPDVACLDGTSAFASLAVELNGDVTRDGRRLNRRGHWLLAMLVVNGLELASESPKPAKDAGLDPAAAEKLRELVRRKEVDWEVSGHQGGERSRGWDQALWSSPKPALASLWAVEPEAMEVCPSPPRSLGMPTPSQFGMGARTNPTEAVAGIRCAGEIDAALWASEVGFELWNPVNLRFDHEGRAWIGCAPPGLPPCLIRVEDLDRDSLADRQVIALSGAIHPEGFMPGVDGVYVSTGEGLTWYGDADGDGAADRQEIVLGGVALRRGLRWGPDGGLWFTSDGGSGGARSRLIETPWGGVRDGGAGLFRWRPSTGKVERHVQSEAGREVFFDEWGEPLLVPGRYGSPIGQDRVGHWAGEPPSPIGDGVVGLGEPGPWVMLQGDRWPKAWRGGFVRAERGAEGNWQLWVYVPEWAGSIRRWRRQDAPVLTSTDPNFCPVAIEAGPDGALYLLDACGREKRLRAGSFGRIWRIAGRRWPPSWAAPGNGVDSVSLLQQLHQGGAEGAEGSRLALWHRPPGDVFTALGAYLPLVAENGPDRQRILLEALRLHQAFGAQNPELLSRLTQSPDPGGRYAAAHALAEWGAGLRDRAVLLQRLIEDENPRVRTAALLAARQMGAKEAGAIASLASHQRMDDDLRRVVDATIRQLGSGGTAPASLRAKAKATSTVDLIAGEMTPHAASVILERSGVENSVLKQAAVVLAGRAGVSIERWVVERLEDGGSPDELIANLLRLIALSEGWELYQCSTRLRARVDSAERPSFLKAAYAALAVGAAESGTLDALIDSVAKSGDFEMAALLDGCAHVMGHARLRSQISPIIRAELSRPDTPAIAGGVKVRLEAPGWDVLHFAELQVMSGGHNIAKERPARQSQSPNGKRWWATLAKNGVNGVVNWEDELPLKDLVPGAEAVRGVKVAASGGLPGPWWEVDLGSQQVVERLVYHPGEAITAPRPLRFALLNAEGEPIWTAVRYSRNDARIELDIAMSQERRQAAVRVAQALGEDFRRSLETVARHSALLQDRFNAFRALQRLGGEISGLRLRMFELQFGEEGFNKRALTVAARDAVELTLSNVRKRDLAVGIFEEAPGATVPVLPLGLVAAGEEVRFPFVAPAKPGAYFLRSMEAGAETAEFLQVRVEVIPPPPPPKK